MKNDLHEGTMAELHEQLSEEDLESEVIQRLKMVYDPELPVNIYDLGLIYEIRIIDVDKVYIRMTLTAPACPAAGILPGQVESAVREIEGVTDVEVDLTFDPPYHRDMMSDEAKIELGLYY